MAGSVQYEIVVGLEVHAQLLTKSKLFCGDSIAYGAAPNTQVSPITLGHPGTLPKMNREAMAFAIKMGLACECEIEQETYFARKNYFYPDLPKGYQVTQHTTPVCKGGRVRIKTTTGEKYVRLNRIHLEEDAGKSLHDADEHATAIDYNRAGTPLIEIVTEPDIRSADEAFAYITEIRRMLRYLEICDGNMEEGSLRCDVNISVREKGDERLGTKVEIKNLNSIRSVKRAVESESRRIIAAYEKGEQIIQQTRSFDANSGKTFPVRDKEDADDYRYFPEPDLPAFHLGDEFIRNLRESLPVLQPERIRKYTSEFGLTEYDAGVLTAEKDFSDYFERMVAEPGTNIKASANWMLGPVRSWMNETGREITEFPIAPSKLASLVMLVEKGSVSFSSASTRLFNRLIVEPEKDPAALSKEMDLDIESGTGSLEPIIDRVLEKFASKVTEYKKGKKGLLALFVGEVMKQSGGKADPKITNELLVEKLKN